MTRAATVCQSSQNRAASGDISNSACGRACPARVSEANEDPGPRSNFAKRQYSMAVVSFCGSQARLLLLTSADHLKDHANSGHFSRSVRVSQLRLQNAISPARQDVNEK